MSNDRDLDDIFARIAKRIDTEEDIQTLRQLLRVTQGQNTFQIGKYIVNIAEIVNTAKGCDIHIGDKIYKSTDAETIRAILLEMLADKDLIDKTFHRLLPPSASSSVDWDWGMKLLQQQLPNIRKRLTDTLGRDRISIDISIEERQHWVNRSPLAAARTLQIDGRDCGTLDANKKLIEILGRDDIEKKLLILGALGAGKTTELVSLAEQLVDGAISQPRTLIPVIFELSTWRNDNQSIQSWLIEQLYDLSPRNRKSNIYEKWLEHQVLLPLLDGLDELGLERQKKCTQKLNKFAEHYPHLVICCRNKDFEAADIKLPNLRGAVCLQSLSDSQIQHYLNRIDRSDVWEAIRTNPFLQALMANTLEGDPGLLRLPLFVKFFADVYDPQQPINGKEDLLDKYIDLQLFFGKREFARHNGLNKRKWAYKTVKLEPDQKIVRICLKWLAENLRDHNSVEFTIERIQPNWLFTNIREKYFLVYYRVSRLTLSLIICLAAGILAGFSFQQLLIFLVICMISISYILKAKQNIPQFDKIDTFEDFQIPEISKVIKGLKFVFCLVLSLSLFIGFLHGLSVGFLHGLSVGFFNGLIIGLIAGMVMLVPSLIFVLVDVVKSDLEPKKQLRPNQGIWISLIYCISVIIITIFSLLVLSCINPSLRQYWMFGLEIALIVGFMTGGKAFLQHWCLRFVLWRSGLPWDFTRFLNYCYERKLLLRIGGRYRFFHRELLDHFAKSNC
jgi:Effector-associated domain 10/NACHT domain